MWPERWQNRERERARVCIRRAKWRGRRSGCAETSDGEGWVKGGPGEGIACSRYREGKIKSGQFL